MKETVIYTNQQHWASGLKLTTRLGARLVVGDHPHVFSVNEKTLINWGNPFSIMDEYKFHHVLNRSVRIAMVQDKNMFFSALDHPDPGTIYPKTPKYTTNPDIAKNWVDDGEVVLAYRDGINRNGTGVSVIQERLDFQPGLFYTTYIPVDEEYRVHVINDAPVFIEKKIPDADKSVSDWYIRTEATGFVWVEYTYLMPQAVIPEALKATRFFGLDIGAVDIVVHHNQPYVLGIDPAPELSDRLASFYTKALRNMI